MRSFVDEIKALEGKDGILSISIAHGFPFGDVPGMGTKVLVVTDGHAELGALLAKELGERLFAMRGQTAPPFLGVDEGIDRALAIEGGPVVIADPSDNPGGGAPERCHGDPSRADRARRRATRRSGRSGTRSRCSSASPPARVPGSPLRFAGKTGPASGQPIDAEVEIRRVVRGATQTFGQSVVDMGDCAAVRIGGIDIVLTTRRRQALRHRPVRQSRHRSGGQEDRGREVDQPLLCVVRADRQGGAVRRFRRARCRAICARSPFAGSSGRNGRSTSSRSAQPNV